MKTELLRRLKSITCITNIFEKERKHIKFKSLLKILHKFPDLYVIRIVEKYDKNNKCL